MLKIQRKEDKREGGREGMGEGGRKLLNYYCIVVSKDIKEVCRVRIQVIWRRQTLNEEN